MHRSFAPIVLTLLLVVPCADTSGQEIYIGPRDSTGRIHLTPPTLEEMQKMVEARGESHACAQKSEARLSDIRGTQSPLVVVSPTANMYAYDVLHYKIDIEIDMGSEWIGGYVEMRAKSLVSGLSYIDLTFTPLLNVTVVRLDGISQSFSHTTEILSVYLSETFDSGDEFTIKVEYNGYPPYYGGGTGLFFDYYDGRKVCNNSCEPFGSRNWWPCKDFSFDKPDSADIIITHPTYYGGYEMDCVSAGTLISITDNGDGTTTTHWFEKHPIATYLVAIVLTEFSQIVQSWEYAPGQFMPVEHNHFPSISPDNPYSSTMYMVSHTLPALDAYSARWGLYPFYDEKYGNMHCTFPGMEHQTMSSIGTMWSDEYVIIHELAHQWAGDQVTCSPFNHVWLNEGFGTYAEILFYEYHYGWPTAYFWLMSYRYLGVGSPYVEDLANDNIFEFQAVYAKGCWLGHMLRRQIGDSVFFPAMRYFYQESEFAGGSASTDDFNSVVSEFYGSDLSWFFDAWVYQSGQPNYRYFYEYEPDTAAGDGYLVQFFLEQNNNEGPFPMFVDIVAFAGDYDTLYKVWNGTEGDPYEFHLPAPPDSFQIDPEDKILKTVTHVSPSMHIVTGSLPDAILGEPYSMTLQAMWGVPPYTWEKTLGQFPPGLSFDEETGEFSGTPTYETTSWFRIVCTDSDGPPNTDQRGFTLSVVAGYAIGDCDGSGEIDIDDVVFLINYIFSGGPAPDPIELGDADCSGEIDIDDVVFLIAYIFSSGPAPCE